MTDLWPDAETGEMISDGTVLSFEAASNITKGDLVYLSADMTVSKCTAATQHALGVALTTVQTGEVCSVCTRGVVKVTAGDAIDRGEAIQTDADAQAITLADGSATYDETDGHDYYNTQTTPTANVANDTEASPATIDSTDHTNAEKTKAVILQCKVANDAVQGEQADETLSFKYDEI